MTEIKFMKRYEYNQINFYDENNKRYNGYNCKDCIDITPHRFVMITERDSAIYECMKCGKLKYIYVGLRKCPQHTMM